MGGERLGRCALVVAVVLAASAARAADSGVGSSTPGTLVEADAPARAAGPLTGAVMPPTRVGAAVPLVQRPAPAAATTPATQRRERRIGQWLLWGFTGALVASAVAIGIVVLRPSPDPYPGTLGTVEIP
jgi:hypothetical protein